MQLWLQSSCSIIDEGYIDNSTALPITELRFGGLHYNDQSGFHTLGKLTCQGKVNGKPIIFFVMEF